MRITTKGQVTIPKHMREAAGFLPHTEVAFVLDGTEVRIVKAGRTRRKTRGELIVEALRNARGQTNYTTDQIMAMTRGDD